jgi:putative ABC transport system permease protein
VLGTLLGMWLGRGLTEMYTEFFRFPVLEFRFDWAVVIGAVLVSLAAGVLGTLAAVGQAVRLPPAEAMRPQPPAQYRPTVLERIGLQSWFPHAVRMVLRNLERHPLKSLMSCLGIATGLAVVIIGRFMKDSIDYVMEEQFFHAQRQDMTVTFVEPLSSRALHEVEHLRGVRACEPFRAVPVRLRFGHYSRRVGITGLLPEGKLFLPLDIEGESVGVPRDGLLVSRVLAEVLHIEAGDVVQVEVLEGKRPRLQARISGLLDDFAGLSAYMSLDRVRELLQEGDTLSGAYLSVDPNYVKPLYAELKNTPKVAGVNIKLAALHSFRETIAKNLLRMQAINVLFASVIACGVVYNSARISLSERTRELATLRVLGFTRAEISAILLGELALLTGAAIPLGMVLGRLLAWLVTFATIDTEMFRIPLVIEPATYAFAVTVIVVAALLSGLVVRRRLDELDLIAVLKSRD